MISPPDDLDFMMKHHAPRLATMPGLSFSTVTVKNGASTHRLIISLEQQGPGSHAAHVYRHIPGHPGRPATLAPMGTYCGATRADALARARQQIANDYRPAYRRPLTMTELQTVAKINGAIIASRSIHRAPEFETYAIIMADSQNEKSPPRTIAVMTHESRAGAAHRPPQYQAKAMIYNHHMRRLERIEADTTAYTREEATDALLSAIRGMPDPIDPDDGPPPRGGAQMMVSIPNRAAYNPPADVPGTVSHWHTPATYMLERDGTATKIDFPRHKLNAGARLHATQQIHNLADILAIGTAPAAAERAEIYDGRQFADLRPAIQIWRRED